MAPLVSVVRRSGRSGVTVRSRRWRELSSRQRAMLIIVGSIELLLTANAAGDLHYRPSDRVRGPKALWWPAIFVQPVGPIAYLVCGRRQTT